MSVIQQEESPQSEGMDISEEASLDSYGASSTDCNDADIIKPAVPPTLTNHNKANRISSVVPKNTENDNDIFGVSATPLDNRTIQSEQISLLLDSTTQRRNFARTLAYDHPLMSPPVLDVDSEIEVAQVHRGLEQQVKHNNYPDVVPRREHLYLQLPVTAEQTSGSALNTSDKMPIPAITHKPSQKVLRASSPDLLSSGSELNVSQYQASVDAHLQAVTLIQNREFSGLRNEKNVQLATNKPGGDDLSSLDSISNHSFDGDEDLEHNLASLSPSSSLMDGLDDDDDEDCEGPELIPDDENGFPEAITPTPCREAASSVTADAKAELPQYSAAEERRDSRNWQKITLPDGRTRDIDMRVIEPYKRVLSHGGYLKAGGHNAIVIFCACHLPDRSRTDYSYVMDNLFLYVVKTLEQLVTDDYVLIYLHGGSSRRNVPPFPWLKKCYQLLDRRLRKSLKNMYLVHPTFWIKSLVWMARPFVSAKFWRKLIYVKSLDELSMYVAAVEKAAIPEKVKQYDAKNN